MDKTIDRASNSMTEDAENLVEAQRAIYRSLCNTHAMLELELLRTAIEIPGEGTSFIEIK